MAHQPHRRPSAEGPSFRAKLAHIETSVGKGVRARNHIDIFRRGPAAWNSWRNKARSVVPDLCGLKLDPGDREMDATHGGPINLNSALLRGADLRSARLPAADLDRADLRGADLCHGHLSQANLCSADLRAARLDHADLTGVELKKADLRGARLRSVNLTDGDLRGANLSGADLIHARLNGANLAGANLREAKLDYTDFANAKLKGADLAGACLYHAKNLTRAQLDEAKFDECTLLPARLSVPTSLSQADALPKPSSKPNAIRVSASPAAISLPFRWALNRRVSWVVAAVLWTLVIIVLAMKQSSVAVALLPPVVPAMPEFSLATATAPLLAPSRSSTRERPSDDTKSAVRPRVLAALSDPRVATRSSPAVIDEPTGKSPSIGMVLRAEPLQQIGPDSEMKDIEPDLVPASHAEARNLRTASLQQTDLRPVLTQPVTIRLPDAPEDISLAEGPAEGPMTLIVTLRHQRLDVYRGAKLIETSAISSGMKDHETMAGVFSILEKRRYHHSNMFSDAPMPWMQRLTRSGTALHGGVVPGYPASHGCIRLPFSFATKLFQMTEPGTNVIVADEEIVPVRITHRNLPQPTSVLASVSKPQAALERDSMTDASSTPPLRILVTRRTLRDRLISLQRTLSELGYLAPQNFTGRIGRQSTAAIKAFQKANDMPVTGKASTELAAAIYKAAGKDVPPAGHLFVRQGYKRLFDAPIAFSDPDRSLGTHVFTSMAGAPDETELVWLGMSLEGGDLAGTLDRLQFTDDLREKLGAALTPGSTFIIGDLSLDTSILPEGDDFIVLTKEVPEVPVAAATPTATKPAAKKPTVYRQAKRPSRKVTREARRSSGSRNNFPRGLFSRW